MAFGILGGVGGIAIGVYSIGGLTIGPHTIYNSPEFREFIRSLFGSK